MAGSTSGVVLPDLQSVINEIDASSDLSLEQRQELRQNLQQVADIETSGRLQRGIASANAPINRNTQSPAVRNITTLMKFTGQGLLEVGKLVSLPTRIICTAIAAVVVKVFSKDMVVQIAEEFKTVLDERFMIRCHATSHKFKNCVRYLNGLPRPSDLNDDLRKMYISRLASDNPVNTGLKEIAILGVEIQTLLDSETPDMPLLMNKVQMYCCLTTFRELFLLARFTIESSYGICTQSIVNVLEGQRDDDQRLLSFLYKPNRDTLHIFLEYKPDQWPIVAEFIQRRRLDTNLNRFNSRFFQIRSVTNPENLLSYHNLELFTCMRSQAGTVGDHTFFQLNVNPNGLITIHPLPRREYYVYNRDWIRMDSNPAQESREWQIVEIESDTPDPYPCVVFRLGSQGNRCIYEDWTGRVYVWKHAKGNTKCIWRLVIQHDERGQRENETIELYRRNSSFN